MSELLYNEIPISGDQYKIGDWKKIVVHDDFNIKGFFGEYRWLSNFFDSPVYFEELLYRSSENAYQAAKLLPPYRAELQDVKASDSKKLWKTFGEHSLYDDSSEEWDGRKYDVMSIIVFDKFYRNKRLRQKLLESAHALDIPDTRGNLFNAFVLFH